MSTFISRNRTALLVGATVVVAGAGVAYYLNTSTPVAKEAEVKKKRKNKKKTKSDKAEAEVRGEQPSEAEPAVEPSETLPAVKRESIKNGPSYPKLTAEEIEALPVDQRQAFGLEFKKAGNHFFGLKKFEDAITLYSQGIACDPKDAIYYSNRAACYTNLNQFEQVVEDTTKALEIDRDYVKCLSRRAFAYEKLENYRDSMFDYTAACILTNFKESALNNAVDRVLRLNAEKVVETKYRNQPKKLPSANFITSYLNSFHKRELPESVTRAEAGTGNYDLKLAFDAMSNQTAESYEQAWKLLNKAVENNASDMALALEFRSTFHYFRNDLAEATNDINRSIELKATPQAYVKRASILMEEGALTAATADFEAALRLDPNSADVYYQRAQVAFLSQNFDGAVADYTRAIEIDDTFIYSRLQLAVTRYRQESTAEAVDAFRDLLVRFPNSSEVHNYFGEVLLDLGTLDKAIKEFDVAISLEQKQTGSPSALPLVNKALATFQSTQDIAKAESLCRKALALDPMSEVAMGTLGQLCLQQSKPEEAVKFFTMNAEVARTDAERIQALSFAEAAATQQRIAIERPDLRVKLESAARAQ